MEAYVSTIVKMLVANKYIHLPTIISDYRALDMPRCYIAAGCDTVRGMDYSIHIFPKGDTMRRMWTSAVKRQSYLGWPVVNLSFVFKAF